MNAYRKAILAINPNFRWNPSESEDVFRLDLDEHRRHQVGMLSPMIGSDHMVLSVVGDDGVDMCLVEPQDIKLYLKADTKTWRDA